MRIWEWFLRSAQYSTELPLLKRKKVVSIFLKRESTHLTIGTDQQQHFPEGCCSAVLHSGVRVAPAGSSPVSLRSA